MSNKKTYQEVIEMLQAKKYVAPNRWDSIGDELSLSDQVGQLKSFKVNKDLWSGIEEALDVDQEIKTEEISGKLINRNQGFALLLLVIIAAFVCFLKTSTQQEFIYASEIETNELLSEMPGEDSGNYNLAQEFIAQNKFMFSEDSFIEYNDEVQKIDEAIAEIKLIQEQYGLDDSMIKLLSKMEREKATLIKSMINRT